MATIYRLPDGRWRAQIRRRGQRTSSRIFPGKREAEAWARSVEHGADRGQRLGGARACFAR